MSNLWFTADCHFGHANIIKYCNRPFKTIEQMNMTLIYNWNSRVKKDDMVIHVGDFCFKNSSTGKDGEGLVFKADHYYNQLNGNIVFIKGNHDKHNFLNTKIENLVFGYGNEKYFVTHRPEDISEIYGVNLVGHVHEKWKIQKTLCGNFIYNVGVDVQKFQPVSMQEILGDLSKWKKVRYK